MTDLEIQEQAEKMYPAYDNPKSFAFQNYQVVEMERKSFIKGAKWMQERDKWISVEDRLPTPSNYKQQTVLLVKSDQGHYNYKATAWYGDNVGDGELNFHVFDDLTCINKFKHTKVTHWMEVPE